MQQSAFYQVIAKKTAPVVLLMCWVMVSSSVAQSGGTFSLKWNTIDGGGGISTGGQFVLAGTVGQPDAGYMSGGNYELLGGFWPSIMECIKKSAPEYSDWVAWNKPECWCYPRQCRGDVDGKKIGLFWVQAADLTTFRAAFIEPDQVLRNVQNGICADFDHKRVMQRRVQAADLAIFRTYFYKPEPRVPTCDPTNYNFWKSP